LFLARPTPVIQQPSEELRKDRAARQGIQAQRRQQALWADLGTLVARVAHDIRNPLFGILATAEALESKFGNRETEEYFSVIRSEGERLSRLLAELMEYARPGSVHRKVRERLRTIVDQAILECQQRASERGVRLVVAEHDPDLWVRADVTRLTQLRRSTGRFWQI
jgi:signal transduction histidine kinase